MSFNSPYGTPDENSRPTMFPPATSSPTDFNYTNVPAYGVDPEVQPTGKNSIMSIVGLVLAVLIPLVGLIVSIIAWKQAAETGDNQKLAKIGIIVGIVLFVLNIILGFVVMDMLHSMIVDGTTVPN
jgi:nitric oxide reductase large subunit